MRAIAADTMLAPSCRWSAAAQRQPRAHPAPADRVSGWFVPWWSSAGRADLVAWLAMGAGTAFSHALIAAVAVLIIARPLRCGGWPPGCRSWWGSRGAQEGVLIRDAEALEDGAVDTLVVDKTER